MSSAALVVLTSVALAACGGDRSSAGSPDDGAGPGEEAGSADVGAEDGTRPGGREGAAVAGVHGQAPAASGGLPSIVILTPTEPPRDSGADGLDQAAGGRRPARGEEAVIDQFGLVFSPRVLVVAAGSPVRFTNSEGAITHNVHIRSIAGDSTVFNGDTGPSEGIDVALPGPGGYDVLCGMHPGMTGFVYVTDAPYAAAAETNGSFHLGPVEPGEYTARVWTAREGLGPEQAVTVHEGPTDLDLRQPS